MLSGYFLFSVRMIFSEVLKRGVVMKLDEQIKFIRGKIKELETKRGLIYEALVFKEDELAKITDEINNFDELAKITDEINNFEEVAGTLENILIWAASKL